MELRAIDNALGFIMFNKVSDFVEWLNGELNKRGWGYNELARQASVSGGQVSHVMTRRKKPGYEFCIKVAQALKEPPERVLRLAGLLPPKPERDPYFEALEVLWGMIPDWKKRDMVVQLRAYVEDYERCIAEEEAQRKTGEPGKKD